MDTRHVCILLLIMTKFIIGVLCLIILVYSCFNKKEPLKNLKKFRSFEIGYSNGWTRGFSVWVDSNKIFFSPQTIDTVKYGVLPDSIFQLIKTTFLKITGDTTIKSKDRGCVDCSILGIQTVIGNDTITIRQVGDINNLFWPVIKTLQTFVDSSSLSKLHATLFLESQKIAFPPPMPPIPNGRKFLPPKTIR